MKCDACDKEMTDEKTGRSFIGAEISFTATEDLEPEYVEFIKAQAAPYEADRVYRVCWPCWLQSYGIKP